MKKTALGLLAALILLPSVTFAAVDRQELEAERIELMKQLIVLLQLQIKNLQLLLAEQRSIEPSVLGVATSTSPSIEEDEEDEETPRRRRGGGGGGGGGSSNNTPPPAPELPTLAFTAEPAIATEGATSTLSWNSEHATTCTGSGGWGGVKAVDGTEVVAPTTSTEYILTCAGEGGSIEKTATVTVEKLVPPYAAFLHIGQSVEDPSPTTLLVERNAISDWHNIFAFTIDSDDSEGPIAINQIPVTVAFSDSTFETLVADAELIIGTTTLGEYTIDTDATTTKLTFDVNRSVAVDTGNEIVALLRLEFNPIAEELEGTTVQGMITSENVNAISATGAEPLDNVDPDQLTGSATGEVHAVRTEGLIIDFVDSSIDLIENDDTIPDDDEGQFSIEFDLTAFESDFYILGEATEDASTGFVYTILDTDGFTIDSGAIGVVTSTADEDSPNVFTIQEGLTENFELIVIFNPDINDFYRLELTEINFSKSQDGTTEPSTLIPLPVEDYRTDYLSI